MKDKWLDDWKRTKKKFEELTGKKKPSEKLLGIFRKSSGMESALKSCDKGIEALDKNWTQGDQKRLKSQQDMQKAIVSFQKEADKYTQMLDSAIAKSKDAEEKTVYYRGLKMLKAKLAEYADSYEQSLAFDQAQLEEGESYADKHWKIAEKKLKAAVSTAVARVKTAAAVVSKEKEESWPDFITNLTQGIRELTWALENVQDARKKGAELADPAGLLKSLSTLEGKLPNGPGVLDASQMLAFTKTLAEIAKAVKKTYKI